MRCRRNTLEDPELSLRALDESGRGTRGRPHRNYCCGLPYQCCCHPFPSAPPVHDETDGRDPAAALLIFFVFFEHPILPLLATKLSTFHIIHTDSAAIMFDETDIGREMGMRIWWKRNLSIIKLYRQ